MTDLLGYLLESVDAARLCRAEVVDVVGARIDVMTLDGGEPDHLRCDLLATTDAAPLTLHPGDVVLVWSPSGAGARPVIIGRVGPRAAVRAAVPTAAPTPAAASPEPPETLTLEATESLTLRVGDGSITIRADGKILIKGKDLVSHAQRTNRIRGGSVAIN
jgi:hypothetical protein